MSLGHVKTTEHLTGKRPAGDELFAPEAHPYAPCSLNLDASPADKLSTPLTDHPELTIKRTWSFAGHSQDPLCVEYRYTPRTTTSLVVWILWTMTSSGFAFALQKHGSDWLITHRWKNVIGMCLLLVASKSLISESAVAYPTLGIQLESTVALTIPVPFLYTARPFILPLGTSKRFIPISTLKSSSGVILNETFRRWSVVYYLGLMSHSGLREAVAGERVEGLEVHVVFPNTRPRFPVLLEVYHGLRETLFNEWAQPG